MNDQNRFQITQIAREICLRHNCEIVKIDFENQKIDIEGPLDDPEARGRCIKEIEQMLALYLS
jgi:hypothetical protein